MNAGETMMRVYSTLKEQVMAGAFAPGERLDPSRLAPELAASTTPVRDALHRLAGERLIENPNHEGFRQPHINEATLRDLYEWSHQICLVAVAAAVRARSSPGAERPRHGEDVAESIRQTFLAIAEASPNREHRAAMSGLNDRLAIYRQAELRVMEGVRPEIWLLDDAVRERNWHQVRILLNRFHRRRQRAIHLITAMLRPT
jgi:DNA-binding GntR family transcriptional regulator